LEKSTVYSLSSSLNETRVLQPIDIDEESIPFQVSRLDFEESEQEDCFVH